MQEHIRRAHPEHYISKLPATEESFILMINTPPSERRQADSSPASAPRSMLHPPPPHPASINSPIQFPLHFSATYTANQISTTVYLIMQKKSAIRARLGISMTYRTIFSVSAQHMRQPH